jgi:uncharacterized protein (DUF2141 family)
MSWLYFTSFKKTSMKKFYVLVTILFLSRLSIAFNFPIATTGKLTITVSNIRTNQGEVECVLFNKSEGFPDEPKSAFKIVRGTIHNGTVTLIFDTIPFGEYAVSVYHDENNNRKLDETWYHMPIEGVGVSNNPKVGVFSPPNFETAKFRFDVSHPSILIKMKYL